MKGCGRRNRVRVGHRLLEPLSTLHADLWIPWHSWPCAAGGRRHPHGAPGPDGVRQYRRRRLLQHRRRALDPCASLQHEHHGVPARQPDLRVDQDAGVADLAARNQSNTTPRGSYLEALQPLSVTLGVQNVSFVAQAVDWIPETLYDIVKAAYHHRGMSFVRIIQRCPEWLPKMWDPFLHDRRAS